MQMARHSCYIKILNCVADFKTYSKIIIWMKVNLQGKDSGLVMNAYAPTYSAEDEKCDNFLMILKEQ